MKSACDKDRIVTKRQEKGTKIANEKIITLVTMTTSPNREALTKPDVSVRLNITDRFSDGKLTRNNKNHTTHKESMQRDHPEKSKPSTGSFC